jgi:acetyltransferase-like isoleucine patch superfamily enzyme
MMEGDAGAPRTFDPSRESSLELKAFLEFRETGQIPLRHSVPLGLRALLTDVPVAIICHWPGPVGMKLRQLYYRFRFGSMGSNVLIGHAVETTMPKRIRVSDYVFIDHHVTLDALGGEIDIGRRIHIAPYAIIAGAGGVYLEDYAAVGAFARIYSHSEAPVDGKRMSGPMIPESMKGMVTAPVRLGRDALVGTGAVLLPGVTLGDGAIVGANSFVPAHTTIPSWAIYAGVPARLVGLRSKVTVPDI